MAIFLKYFFDIYFFKKYETKKYITYKYYKNDYYILYRINKTNNIKYIIYVKKSISQLKKKIYIYDYQRENIYLKIDNMSMNFYRNKLYNKIINGIYFNYRGDSKYYFKNRFKINKQNKLIKYNSYPMNISNEIYCKLFYLYINNKIKFVKEYDENYCDFYKTIDKILYINNRCLFIFD